MALMLILCAALTATYQPHWENSAAAWSTAVFIWLYVGFFGASWVGLTVRLHCNVDDLILVYLGACIVDSHF